MVDAPRRRALRVRAGLALLALLLVGGCEPDRPAPADGGAAPDTAAGARGGRGFGGEGLTGTLRLRVAEGLRAVGEGQSRTFMRRYPGARIELTPSTAREALNALLQGQADAVLIDRALNAEERAAFAAAQVVVNEVGVGTGALAFVVPSASAVRGLDGAALRRLVGGEPTAWAALADSTAGAAPAGFARLALPPLNVGQVEVLAAALLPPGTLPRPAYPARDEADALAWVGANPDALGVVSLAALRADTTGRVRALAVPDSTGRAVPLSQRAVADGRYPFRQPAVLVVRGGLGPIGPGFATFARGLHGQEEVLRAGLVPAVMPAREIVLE